VQEEKKFNVSNLIFVSSLHKHNSSNIS